MKVFWILHFAGALTFASLAVVLETPEERLPSWAGAAAGQVRRQVVFPLAARLPLGTSADAESLKVMRRMAEERYADRMNQLEKERSRLETQLKNLAESRNSAKEKRQ